MAVAVLSAALGVPGTAVVVVDVRRVCSEGSGGTGARPSARPQTAASHQAGLARHQLRIQSVSLLHTPPTS